MKRLEEMSHEELIEEAIYLSKRIEEQEAARKEEERKIAELKKHEKLLTDMEKAIKNGQFDLSEFKQQLQELLKIKDERIAKLRSEIEIMENNHERLKFLHSVDHRCK